ncbi:MAG TPA: choice-of-anchor P family protein, partial [Nocardioidaceae bacterium]|nr:choice-of-anchor P family protein [Nocardioidaceae bacterium]
MRPTTFRSSGSGARSGRRVGRIAGAFLAAGLIGAAAPVPAASAAPAYGGYSTEATATPLKIEVYEPTIPIPAEPQAEAEFAYTKVEAASGPTGDGLASWLWPGDPVGQGCKTFVETLGLGATGLCKDGYPVQVNSQTPGEPSSESDEKFPGSVMRTSAGPEEVSATAGWSPDCDVMDDRKAPGLPGAPGGSTAADDQPQGCIPAELAAMVDVDGMTSDSRTETAGDTVKSVATSKLTGVSLIGGLITADSITVTSTTTADGKQPTAGGVSKVVGLKLAGKPLTFGRDGVQLADQSQKLPGMPDQAKQALAQLGVQLALPSPERSASGDNANSGFEGLQVVIDTRPLRSQLDDIPFDDILGLIPDQAEELRKLLGAATQLAPKFVITAGNAAAEASTVPKLDLSLPSVDPGSLNGAAVPPSSGSTTGGSSGVTPGSAGAPAAALGGDAGAAPSGDAGALAAKPMSSSLPPLASIPGALLVGGFVIA